MPALVRHARAAFPFWPVLNEQVRVWCESDRRLFRTAQVSPERRVNRTFRRVADHKGIIMADICDTDTVVRTFNREVDRLKSAADTIQRANRGSPVINRPAAPPASAADSIGGAWAATDISGPATTISAALGGSDVSGPAPKLLFLGGSFAGPDGFRISGAASGATCDLWTLLTLREQSMSSFVPDHGLRIGGKGKTAGR